MDNVAFNSATLTTHHAKSSQAERPTGLWVLTAALVVIAAVVLLADSSLTAAQRIALFMQSGTFP